MSYLRTIKVVLVASVALFAALVTFNNVIDYGSNYAFVEHVLSMDTTFEGNQLMHRAIDSPTLHHAFYWLIILAEGLVTMLCTIGAWKMFSHKKDSIYEFNDAKKLANIGLTIGVLLWFTGFITIGGEWFVMWQSQIWNGQQSAFRFVVILFLVLTFINQNEQDS